MNKVYTRINWKNYPSTETAVNESNLNKMDSALNEIDTRVVEQETTKANVASLNELINYWNIDETTGIITIRKVNGEQIIFDLNIEKVPVGFSMTDDGILIMTTDDGTEFTANIGSMIPILTFQDTDEIAVSVNGEGANKTYSFAIKTGSIREDKLQPNFLADCRLYAGNAEESANLAGEYAEQAKELVEEAEASFTKLSYADYQAGNYDNTKSYAIPDYPYSNGSASQTSFDDRNAQLGSDNVQGAIEALKSNIDDLGAPLSMSIIDISTYTVDREKKYLCPSDGLAWMSCNEVSTMGFMNIYASNGVSFSYITCPVDNVIAFPVRKGMYIQGSNFAAMRFVKYEY